MQGQRIPARCQRPTPVRQGGILGLSLIALVLTLAYRPGARAAPSPQWLALAPSLVAQDLHPSAPQWQEPDLDYHVFLPLMTNQFPERLLEIYDSYGTLQSWDWLSSRFGAVWLLRGNGAVPVRVLGEEASGQTVLIVSVERAGQPLPGIPVMFYWPDAPWLDPSLQACGLDRALPVHTNADGEAHFAMGSGSAYWPPAGGPHVVWVGGAASDCLGGLGWLGGTNHIHLNSTWVLP